MIEIKRTPEFDRWFNGLKAVTTKMRLVTRLKKVSRGNLGDVQSVGKGWRMYFVQRGSVLVVMLGGGDKSTQTRDIAKAIALSKTLED